MNSKLFCRFLEGVIHSKPSDFFLQFAKRFFSQSSMLSYHWQTLFLGTTFTTVGRRIVVFFARSCKKMGPFKKGSNCVTSLWIAAAAIHKIQLVDCVWCIAAAAMHEPQYTTDYITPRALWLVHCGHIIYSYLKKNCCRNARAAIHELNYNLVDCSSCNPQADHGLQLPQLAGVGKI